MYRLFFILILLFSLLLGNPLFSSAAKDSPSPGGTLHTATISDPKTFNLIVAQETSTTGAVGILFEGLTRINGITTNPEPALAQEWSHQPDGLTWFFKLRQDVTWFDGNKFTAADVVFTFNKLIYNEDIPCSARDIFTINDKKFTITQIDDYTVKITTPTPYAPLLRHLSQPILPKHILAPSVQAGKFPETWGINTPPKQIIGTGPFMLVEYLPSQRLVYKRNPNYWRRNKKGQQLPYLNQLVTYIVQNIDVQLMKFKAGEIDMVSVPGKDYALLKKTAPKENYTIYDCGASLGSTFITFNQNKKYTGDTKWIWFSDLRFRQAVAHAIDKETIINNVMAGMGSSQNSAMSKAAAFFHNPNVRKYLYNPEKAKQLLKQADFVDSNNDGILEKPPGTPVKFVLLTNAENNIRVDIGTIIQSDLKAIGLDVASRPIDFNNLVNKLNYTYKWDSVLIGFTGGIEPHGGKNVWATTGHLHIWNLHPEEIISWEKEIDTIFDQGVQELDPEKRRRFYWKWQEIVANNLPLIYTVTPKAIYAVNNRLQNIHPTAYGGALHNIEEISIQN